MKHPMGFHDQVGGQSEEVEDEYVPPPRQQPQRIQERYRSQAPREWNADSPPLIVPEWEELGLAHCSLDLASRHMLALGETGSGKTKSAVVPLLKALADHRTEYGRPCLLVIDPKRELTHELRTIRHSGGGCPIVQFGEEGGPVLNRFEGVDALDVQAGEVVRRILSPSVSYRTEAHHTNNSFFLSAGERLLEQLVDLDLILYREGGVGFVAAFWERLPRHLHGNAPFLEYRPDHYLSRYIALLRYASDYQDGAYTAVGETLKEFGLKQVAGRVSAETMASDTYSSVVATMMNALREVGSEEVSRCVSLNPLEPPANSFSVKTFMEDGGWMTFQPSGSSLVDDYIGRSLKTSFFEITFQRNPLRGFFYIADEAHRYVTGDETSGEQSYLDRCRAYRAGCLLATQSVASLAYALQNGTPGPASSTALDVMLANVGTTFFFRNSDPTTADRLRNLLPDPSLPERPHIVNVRPPVTLAPGECYAMIGDGRWGRFQVALRDSDWPKDWES